MPLHLTKKELQELIDTVKAQGGDASELERFLGELTNKPRRDVTIADYWEVWHSLPAQAEVGEEAETILQIVDSVGLSLVEGKNLARHALTLKALGNYCPYVKSEGCPCDAVLVRDRECKARVFIR